jgi:hypothetical protein
MGDTSRTGTGTERPARARHWPSALVLLACLGVLLGAFSHWPLGTADSPQTAGLTHPQPRLAAGAAARFGMVEAFRAPLRAAQLPIRWERIPLEWRELQKRGPDSWDPFAAVGDRVLANEIRQGRAPVGLLMNTPDWAAANPAWHGNSPPKGLYLPYNSPGNVWGRFVALAAGKYAGRIDDWIIWNEISIRRGHWKTWSGTYADYAQLVRVAYQAAKSVNVNARIVLAGDPYWYDHGAFFSEMLHRLIAMPGARANNFYFDVANLHLYSRPTDVIAVVARYRAMMHQVGMGKPIWIGETNAIPYNDSARPYPRGGFRASLDDQASFMVQAFALDLAVGVQRFEVNRLLDGANFRAGGEPFGLVRNTGSVRPAFYAYRTAAQLFAGVTGGHVAVNTASGVYTVSLRRPGGTVLVLWDQHPAAAEARLRLPARAAEYDKFGLRLPIVRQAGMVRLHLAGARGNTNSADPRDYVIGGNPVIVVE